MTDSLMPFQLFATTFHVQKSSFLLSVTCFFGKPGRRKNCKDLACFIRFINLPCRLISSEGKPGKFLILIMVA